MDKIKFAARLFVMLFFMLAFINCGRVGFNASKGSLSGLGSFGSKACEDLLLQTYSKTYFPILSTSCNRCHSNAHGSTDLSLSFRSFMSKTAATIDFKATHPHGDNGLNLTNEISAIKPQWNQGQDEYMTCLSSVSSSSGNNGVRLKTNKKPIPGISDTIAKPDSWKPVEWDLETEVPAVDVGKFAAVLRIEARFAQQGGEVVGLEFRNPSLRLKTAGKNLQVSGLNIYLDDQLQSDVTTYLGLTSTVSATTDTLLISNAANAYDYNLDVTSSSGLAIEIQNIQSVDSSTAPSVDTLPAPPPLGEPVTFMQLTSTDLSLGIFRSNCFACHSGLNPSAGFNISDYGSAQSLATTILTRMNDSNRPMPPSGLLPQEERDVVSRWINYGTPK